LTEERRKIDTERRIHENREEQRQLEEAARATENEIHTRRLVNRIEVSYCILITVLS